MEGKACRVPRARALGSRVARAAVLNQAGRGVRAGGVLQQAPMHSKNTAAARGGVGNIDHCRQVYSTRVWAMRGQGIIAAAATFVPEPGLHTCVVCLCAVSGRGASQVLPWCAAGAQSREAVGFGAEKLQPLRWHPR